MWPIATIYIQYTHAHTHCIYKYTIYISTTHTHICTHTHTHTCIYEHVKSLYSSYADWQFSSKKIYKLINLSCMLPVINLVMQQLTKRTNRNICGMKMVWIGCSCRRPCNTSGLIYETIEPVMQQMFIMYKMRNLEHCTDIFMQ